MLNFSTIREIQRKESECLELVKLEPTFYQELLDLIRKKEEEVLEDCSMVKIKELEHLRKVAEAIAEKRKEKLVMRIILSGGTFNEYEGLAEEEIVFVEKIKVLYKETFIDFRKVKGQKLIEKTCAVESSKDDEEKPQPPKKTEELEVPPTPPEMETTEGSNDEQEDGKEGDDGLVKVVILDDIEPYKGFDGKVYGPFAKGDVVKIPYEEADWLVQNRMAKHKS